MKAFKTVAKVTEGGTIMVEDTPFPEGDAVEVVLLKLETAQQPIEAPPHPHRNSVLEYEDPLGPAVSPDEWEALK